MLEKGEVTSSWSDCLGYVISTLGEHADYYDVDAIADAVFKWRTKFDEIGRIRLDWSGFVMRKKYRPFNGIGEAYWEEVRKHEKR